MPGALPPLTGRLVDAIIEARKKQIDEEIMALTSNLVVDLRAMAATLEPKFPRQHLAWAAADEIERLQREREQWFNWRHEDANTMTHLRSEIGKLFAEREDLRAALLRAEKNTACPDCVESCRLHHQGGADETGASR